MFLHTLLRILKSKVDSHGFNDDEIFLKIFEGFQDPKSGEDIYSEESSLRNILSGARAVKDSLSKQLTTPDGFDLLQGNIEYNYIPLIENKKNLYSSLLDRIQKSKYVLDTHKRQIANQYTDDYFSDVSLASLIALCILIGNYNSSVKCKLGKCESETFFKNYELNISFVFGSTSLLRERIWHCSQQNYFISHKKGNRFAALNIIERLLPKGYIEPEIMDFHFDSSNHDLKTIDDICDSTLDNIAITGEGGIGKTTFMQKVLERTFGSEKEPKEYISSNPIPIFIELNRCPKEIGDWYDDRYQKTNFITRYIADSIQGSEHKYRDYSSLLDKIETEFRKNPYNKPKAYLLLLDGFNEVSTGMGTNGEAIRATLSHEINELRKLPNVRIITTSRVTQSAYYASNFTRVHLNGLEEPDIKKHLSLNGYADSLIGQIIANKNLMKCLTIPLFLCMFSAKKDYEEQVPETYGEILYNFFHKDGNFYNIRQRASEANNNPFEHCPYTTELLLDYVVPYIGWYYVQNDTFSLSRREFRKCINNAINEINFLFSATSKMPLRDFNFELTNARKALRNLQPLTHSYEKDMIISCIHDYLSIVYEFESKGTKDGDPNRYSFIHHHFRDYFSAMWNINVMRLLPYYGKESSIDCVHKCISEIYWNQSESATIGQILQEHHNRPILNPNTQNWSLPQPTSDDQHLLSDLLDFCRDHQHERSTSLKIILQNLINTFNTCRGELSGICFDKLDLRECNFHNMTCSKKGKTEILAATFRLSKLSEDSFEPLEHLDSVEECLYAGNRCFTIDNDKLIKVWDVLSGNQITHFNITEESEYPDYSATGFIRVSPDGNQLAVKIQPANPDAGGAYVIVYDLDSKKHEACKIQLPKKHKKIGDFAFTLDSKKLIIIGDTTNVYIYTHHPEIAYDIQKTYKLSKQKRLSNLFSNVRIFTCQDNRYFYLYTYDLDLVDTEYNYYDEFDDSEQEFSYDDYNDSYREEENAGTTCTILKGSLSSCEVKTIFTYVSAPQTTPAFTYIPPCDSFLLFDNNDYQLKLYDCELDDTTTVYHKIMEENNSEMPDAIHHIGGNAKTCYIMYSHLCYHVEVNTTGVSSIIEKYNVPTLENTLSDTSSSELTFMVNTAPTSSRFLLWNDYHETYEWHTENGEPVYKYNTRLYDTKALIPDNKRKIFILVHSQNGVSVFAQDNFKLVNSYCFPDTNYKVAHAEYSSETGNLFLLFERGQHNFIKYINLDTSETETIYSERRPSDGDTKLALSPDGMNLLITTVQYCEEYSLINKSIHRIYFAQPNEWLSTAYYTNNTEIHIGIAMARDYLKPVFEPRCEIYKRADNNNYEFDYGYIIPELDKTIATDFVHENNDTGIPCNYKTNFMQSYWITKGFFKTSSEKITSFLKFKKLCRKNGILQENGTITFDTCCMIQVKHDWAIDNKSEINGTQNTYSYLSPDYKKAMFIHDYELIFYWNKLKDNPDSYDIFDYKNTPELSNCGSTTWDFAIPISNNHFICCTETYRLFPVNAKTGTFKDEICYTPGLAICGCKFKKAIMSEECMKIIKSNGGII